MSEATLQVDPALLERMLNDERRRITRVSDEGETWNRTLFFLLAAFIAWGEGNHQGVTLWALFMIFVPGPIMFRPQWFYSLPDRVFWPSLTLIGGIVYPLGWTALLILAGEQSFTTQMILLFMVSLVILVRSRVSAFNPPEMYAQILVACGSVAIWQWLHDAEHGGIIAVVMGFLAVALLTYNRSIYLGLVRTVTLSAQNQQLTEQLRQQAEQLRQANDAKTRFLASASHDLRQPLHALGLLVGLLGQRIEKPEERSVLGRIEASVGAMEGLLNGILDISRLDAGVEQPQPGPVSVDQLWQQLERGFGAEAARRGLKLRLRPSRQWVVSDAHLLQRMLNNLVSNALRYTRQGGVLVAARQRCDEVWLEVRDTGVGIPADKLDAVFQEFVQLDNPERDRAKGLGLGLAIVKRTAQLLGHRLEVHSREGQGTLFRLRLARVGVPREAPAEPGQIQADVSGLFVLVIDDEQDIRYAMQGLLSDWGCLVITARDGEEAQAVLEHRLRPPEALIIDYRLPKETGLELARKLYATLGAVPTLIITGDVTSAPLLAMQDSGLPVLHKPVNPQTLRDWLGRVKAGAEGGVA